MNAVPVTRFLKGALFFLAAALAVQTASPRYARAAEDGASKAHAQDRGDTIIYGMIGEPSNLIPHLSADSASMTVASNFYIGLLKYDKDLNVVPWAAESFSIEDDGKRLVFNLRKGITWQDGTELSMDDVEFTYKMMIDPATPTAYAGDYKAIKEFKKTGRYTCEVLYEQPFPRSLSTWMGAILPRHLLEGANLRETPLIRKPFSSGPYIMGEWESGAKISMQANPKYFEGEPYISRVLYRIIPDITTTFLELTAGKLDVMSSLSSLQYLYQAKEPSFVKEFDTYKTLASIYTYMGYNLKSPFFSDVAVRRALAHAIDKEDIIKVALLGQGKAITGPYRPDTWAYNKEITPYPYDPEKALALLAEAGWHKGKDGRLQKDGRPFSFTLLTSQGNEQRIAAAVMIQSQLKKIGIDVTIRSVEWAAFLKQFVMPGHFDAVVLAWTLPHDPDSFDVWHSSRIGGLNFINYAEKEVDACLEAARVTFDKAVRKKAYDRFQEILHRDQPYAFLYVPYELSAVQKRFRGIEPAPAGIFHNTNDWWVPLNDQRYRLQAR